MSLEAATRTMLKLMIVMNSTAQAVMSPPPCQQLEKAPLEDCSPLGPITLGFHVFLVVSVKAILVGLALCSA